MNSQSDRLISSEENCLWIETSEVKTIHSEILAAHGGLNGTRDISALESAVMRPRQKLFYEESPLSLSELAAAYGFGIATNHPFNDGNKRTAFTVANVFLLINETRLKAEQNDVVKTMLLLAAGDLSEKDLVTWIASSLTEK